MGNPFSGSQNTQSQTNYSEAPNVSGFRNSLYPQIQQMYAQSQMPVYGQTQYGQQLNNLNGLANSSINQLSNTLAGRTGSLNSGAYAGGVANILNNRASNLSAYNAQVPMLNRQAQFNQGMGVMGLATNFAGRAPVNSSTNSTTTSNPSFMSDLSNIVGLGAGISGMPMFNNLFNPPALGNQGAPGYGNGVYGANQNNLNSIFGSSPGVWQPGGWGSQPAGAP